MDSPWCNEDRFVGELYVRCTGGEKGWLHIRREGEEVVNEVIYNLTRVVGFL